MPRNGTLPRRGANFFFGMDARSKLIHSVKTTTAKVHDSVVFDDLLHEKEKAVFADKACISTEKKKEWRKERKY